MLPRFTKVKPGGVPVLPGVIQVIAGHATVELKKDSHQVKQGCHRDEP